MPLPIITFIGRSNSGKTTLLTKIIPDLKSRGYGIATIKHSHHDVDVDKEGKDSWKHRKAGAETVLLLSGKRLSCIREFEEEPKVEDISGLYIHDADIILAEGFKGSHLPRIWVFRGEATLPSARKDDNLLAVVSDREVDLGVPWFHIDDAASISSFIEDSFLKKN